MTQQHVIFGSSGALGAAIARELIEEGKEVRAVVLNTEAARSVLPSTVDIVAGDALDHESAAAACRGATVVSVVRKSPPVRVSS